MGRTEYGIYEFVMSCSLLLAIPASLGLPHTVLRLIQLQIWETWLFYAVLVDLGDAVAEELSLPFDRISLEIIFAVFIIFP